MDKIKKFLKTYWLAVAVVVLLIVVVVYATRVNWNKDVVSVDTASFNKKVDSLNREMKILQKRDSVSKIKIDSLQVLIGKEGVVRDSVVKIYEGVAANILLMNNDESVLQLSKYLNDEK